MLIVGTIIVGRGCDDGMISSSELESESMDESKMSSSCTEGLGFEFRSYSDSLSESIAVEFVGLSDAGSCSDSVSDMLSSGRLNIWDDREVRESLSVLERKSFC